MRILRTPVPDGVRNHLERPRLPKIIGSRTACAHNLDMPNLSFAYPVYMRDDHKGTITVGCRDLPEATLTLPAGLEELAAQLPAEAVLEVVVERYLQDNRPLPAPSLREPGEYLLAPSPALIARAATQRRP